MYKKEVSVQLSFADFNQPLGLKLDENNRWIQMSKTVPWGKIEEKYAQLFPNNTGMPAKSVRVAFGSLFIQKHYGYSDRELVEQIKENPYYQYFIGFSEYQTKQPFAPSLLVEFRKRLTEDILTEINELIVENNLQSTSYDDNDDDQSNSGTLILDASCAPQQIAFPQDINLLNEAREHCEKIIDDICKENNILHPRTYRKVARKDYLSIAKCKKRPAKRLRKAIKQQLQYIRRDLGYIDQFLADGVILSAKKQELLSIIKKLYEQQQFMHDNRTHSVPNRIVSISQPHIRPIVRGKAKNPVEFGMKFDLSIDNQGIARVEKQSFDAYNESEVLIGAIERYKNKHGRYPERVLADKIYRNRNNLQYCKERGIRLSGSPLGRPKKNEKVDKKQTYTDAVDRIEVERKFSLGKRKYGLGLICTKLACTSKSSVMLSIIAMNIARLIAVFCAFLYSLLYEKISINENKFTRTKSLKFA